MKLKSKPRIQVMSTSSRFTEVAYIDKNEVSFNVYFEIDPEAALDNSVVTCDFRVFDDKKAESPRLKLKALESNAAFQRASSKKASALFDRSRDITSGIIDITKYISNDSIKKILSGAPARIQKRIKTDDTGLDGSRISQQSSSKNEDVKSEIDIKSLYLDMLHRKSKDPAAEINSATFHAPVADVIRGFRTASNLEKVSKKLESARKSLSKKSGLPLSITLKVDAGTSLEIPFIVKMKKEQIKTYTVEILMKSQSLKFKVNFSEAFENHIIPTHPPLLQITNVGARRVIKVKQRDANSNSVAIYRKRVLGDSTDRFVQILKIPLAFNQETQFVDQSNQPEKMIYRAISFNELSVSSGEFSSVILPGQISRKKKTEPDNLAILARETQDGIVVSAFNIPSEVIALRLIRKNLTIYESKFSSPTNILNGPIRKIDKISENFEMLDRPSRIDAVYEYKFIMINAYGEEIESQKNAIVHFAGNAADQEQYELSTTSLRVAESGALNVSFQINSSASQSSLDLIYSTLITAGLDSLYVDEIKSNKELFSKIIAFEMLRFDTTSGLNESFGIIEAGVFTDSPSSRKSAGVSQLIQGRRYIYQFRLLIRAPGTIFAETKVSKIDLETGKSYSVEMKKFNAPKTLKKGTLKSTASQLQVVTKTGLKTDSSSGSAAEMIQGRTALTGKIAVTIPNSNTFIDNFYVEESQRGNIIKWRVNEGLQKIDHIIVHAEYNGKMAPLRALHFFGNSNMIFIDNKLKASIDDVTYYLQAVFQNFQLGQLIGPIKERESVN